MITALDTNVLLDIFGADPSYAPASSDALRGCLKEGSLIASDVVWAETATAFNDSGRFRNAMDSLQVVFSGMTEAASIRAAEAWRRYRAGGGPLNRIAADFLIGAHALIVADQLLTRDRGFYRRYFGGLRILDPTAKG